MQQNKFYRSLFIYLSIGALTSCAELSNEYYKERTIGNKNSEIQLSDSGKAIIPAGFPLPIYPNSKPVIVHRKNNNTPRPISVVLRCADKYPVVLSSYHQQLEQSGWHISSTKTEKYGTTIIATKDTMQAEIIISNLADTNITISLK